jgi:hypothetical protein
MFHILGNNNKVPSICIISVFVAQSQAEQAISIALRASILRITASSRGDCIDIVVT